jgi:hypothetical protein
MSPTNPKSSTSPSPSPSGAPADLRGALRALGEEAPPGEREFAARLHRRLAEAGAPPERTWLDGVLSPFGEGLRAPWHEMQRRTLLTGALLGALVTAAAFLLVASARPPSRDDSRVVSVHASAPVMRYLDRPNLRAERKSPHTLGDRRSARDRLGADFAADRPERPRAHVEPHR